METVNNIAAAASKAIWGEPTAEKTEAGATKTENETAGQEPLSGVLGDVEKGEPFDKGNAEPETSAAATDSVLETTKVLPLRPAGEAPAPSESIEDKSEKELPSLPSTSTPNSTSVDPTEKLVKPTPFVAGLKADESTSESTTAEKLGSGAETTAVKGAGGQQIEGASTVEEPKTVIASESLPTEKKESTTETPAPIVPSKVSSEEGSTEGKEGKEKLSLKEKIKAKLHHKH